MGISSGDQNGSQRVLGGKSVIPSVLYVKVTDLHCFVVVLKDDFSEQ